MTNIIQLTWLLEQPFRSQREGSEEIEETETDAAEARVASDETPTVRQVAGYWPKTPNSETEVIWAENCFGVPGFNFNVAKHNPKTQFRLTRYDGTRNGKSSSFPEASEPAGTRN